MKEYYIGITVGPIVETLITASRPAALWCASSIFSWLAEDLCNGLMEKGGKIISPFYPAKKTASQYSVVTEKAGKYHDRIICLIEAESASEAKDYAKDVICQSKKNLAKVLTEPLNNPGQLRNAIIQYLQIHFIVEEKTSKAEKNCILRLSPYLDAAELCPSFYADQSQQPIITLFEGKEDSARNDYLKKCFNIGDGHTSLLNKNGSIKDIEHIAEGSNSSGNRKIFNYYAIVQADGDNMGQLLAALNSDEMVTDFSSICLNYTTEAADLISAYGGVVIYAGGDDLLFIAPLENSAHKNIFNLCDDIARCFKKSFEEKYPNVPTLSFGISINYKHFPLYEALSDALEMLMEAKKVPQGEEKNKTAVHIRKGSGQAVQFRYTNGSDVFDKLTALISPNIDAVVLNSMLYKIGLYRPILTAALKNQMELTNAFKNLFDSGYHQIVEKYIGSVCEALSVVYQYVLDHPKEKYALKQLFGKTSGNAEETAVDLLYCLLRTARFFSERKGK